MKFLSLLSVWLAAHIASATVIDLVSDAQAGKKALTKKYDYVIVGGGISGLTLARRLAENKGKSILVLEAGGSGAGNPSITIPKNSFAFVGTELDWNFTTTPDEASGNREINISQGRVLGGGSAVNGLVWVRGAKEEYDAFEELGSPDWNWDSLYPAMRKSEDLQVPSAELTDEFGFTIEPSSHGTDGPVQVSFPPYLPIQHQKLLEAGVELGHPHNLDAYSGNPIGAAYSLSSQTNDAVRETSEFSYLDPIKDQHNLVVLTHAVASKVNLGWALWPWGKKMASGVAVQFPNGESIDAHIGWWWKGEVILAAGTIRTPQILELSGVGDKEVLEPLGIKVQLDLPGVGANYEDHPLTILTYELKSEYPSFDALGYNETLAAEMDALYAEKHEGWLAFAQGVVDFEPATTILTAEEMEEAKEILSRKPDGISNEQYEIIQRQVLDGTPQVEFLLFNSFSGGEVKKDGVSYVSLAVTHTHPMSRGTVHISTTDINDNPTINPHMLEAEWDAWFLGKATAYGRKLMQTEAFSEILVEEEVYPGASVQTSEEWVEFSRQSVNLGYHSIGSASMLPQNKNGVVDKNLLVYGTTNLRIVDLSAMPTHISAHTQTIAYAFGEMAADIIKSA